MSNSTQTRWYKSAPVQLDFASGKIDLEAGIIYDVVMVQEGDAQGHGVKLEDEFVENLVAYDQATFSSTGLKARLGHPNASSDAMGTQLGYFRNVRKRRKEGKMQAIGDLHLLAAADASPEKPNMRAWVLQMAQEAPDFIMSSIVFKPSGYYQKKANGHKVRFAEESHASPDMGEVYVEFDPEAGARHFYTDLVEQGAATDSLFSTAANPHLFASRVDQWLDENPDLRNFIQNNPERVAAFLQRAGYVPTTQKKFAMSFSIKQILFGEDQAPDELRAEVEAVRNELQEARDAVSELRAQRDGFEQKYNEAFSEAERLRTEAVSLRAEAEALKQQVFHLEDRVKALEALPVATHTGGEGAPVEPRQSRSWERNPLNQQAARYVRISPTTQAAD